MNTPVSEKIDRLLIEKGIDMPVNPTIADVVMWLYEKHKVFIGLSHLPFNQKFAFRITGGYNQHNKGILHAYTFSHYNSPTEACEAAITYTLNNLI